MVFRGLAVDCGSAVVPGRNFTLPGIRWTVTDRLERVLAAAFPDRQAPATRESPESGNEGNRTVRVDFADGETAYLKLRVDGDAERNAREAAVTRYVGRHRELRVPELLAVDSSFDPPYLATAPIGGTSLDELWERADRDERTRLARESGRLVARIAAPGFEDHDWIAGGDATGLELEAGSWSDVLADAIRRRTAEVGSPDRLAGVTERVRGLCRRSAGVLDGADAALVHQDVRRPNCFLRPTPGAIDWECSLVGDPVLGICWAEGRIVEQADVPEADRGRLRAAVRDGYRSVAGDLPPGFDRRRPFYRVVNFLPTVRTFHLWAPAAPEPVEELATWVRDELEDRIATAEAVA